MSAYRHLPIPGAFCAAFAAMSTPALAQVTLPEVVVTAPSPIAGRAPSPTASDGAQTLQGTLPIVADQFATVTVVPNEELRRSPASTLGDLLFTKPGITGSAFAPGASSRPIIRGLDVNRVGIIQNGVGSSGASDLGEDHFVPIDPLATDRIEVIRGPATLRYGSQSIGGVVSATNNRIPDAAPAGGYSAEFRGGANSVNNGLDGGVLLDAGNSNVAVHADAFQRNAGDYRVPSYPYLFEPGHPFDGRQPNSGARFRGASVGGSYLFDGGYFGLAVNHTDGLYHIPGLDGDEHQTRIDARQTQVTGKGEFRSSGSMIDTLRIWLGATDYKHNEIGLADPADLSTDGIRQTFTNREQEARFEAQLTPFNLRFGELTMALGVQAGHQELTAPGDTPGPFSGLWDPNRNTRVAAYMFNEVRFSDTLKAQLAGRLEHVDLDGSTPDFPAGYLPQPGDVLTSAARNLGFTPKSVSLGIIKDLPWGLSASLTAQRVERAPKAAELFSRGPHDATATFDIGDPNLKIEVAQSVEAGLRRASGPLRFEATAYYTRFNGFIFRRLTGEMCDETFDTCGDPAAELHQAVYSQRNATFRGAEFQSQWDIAPVWNGLWGIENQFDVVRATFTDGTNVPRIPPMRIGAGLFYRDSNWLARVNLLHAFAQKDTSATETETAGYNLLKAELSYTMQIKPQPYGLREASFGIVGDNLLNEDIRNSASYNKDEVLLPGRSVRVFARMKY